MSKNRVDIRAILSDPVLRKDLIVPVIQAVQAVGGIEITREQAERAYDSVHSIKPGVPMGPSTMTVDRAKEILDGEEADFLVDFEPGWETALVDGNFTADQLEAIVVLMRSGEEI